MKSQTVFIVLGWMLIISAVAWGIWSVVDLLTGEHGMFGNPMFVSRDLLRFLIEIVQPIGIGAALLLLAIREPSRG